MSQFPSMPDFGLGGGGDSPRVEVARGVIKIEPDMTEFDAAMEKAEERLEKLSASSRGIGSSPTPEPTPQQAGTDPTFVPPATDFERIAELLSEQTTILQAIYESLRESREG